jgi:hypothetical protein
MRPVITTFDDFLLKVNSGEEKMLRFLYEEVLRSQEERERHRMKSVRQRLRRKNQALPPQETTQ